MKIEEAIIHAMNTSKNTEECKSCRDEHKQLAKWLQELKRIKDILGDDYDLGRLRELVEADKDGGCVVLPCMDGVVMHRYDMEFTPDHWNICMTAFAKDLTTPSGVRVGIFSLKEAIEAASKGEQNG